MTDSIRFDGQVAIVTGAGGGLGQSYAKDLAARGAKVVVNDLGGSLTGQGQSSHAADTVVAEIIAAGGEAVANYDSVEHGDKLVQTALDHWGTVDIVINNAGVLRDISFHKMTQLDWDAVQQTHLSGSFNVSHAAWPILRDKNYGRIVMTSSAAGIYGNFGQANYSAAKLGIVGLAKALAEEGRSKNICVNTIAPIAKSRMTETILPPEILERLNPEYVTPLVAWLASTQCQEIGGLFEVGAGFVAKLRWERSLGHNFPSNAPLTAEDIAAKWSQICDFDGATHPQTANDAFAPVLANIQAQ